MDYTNDGCGIEERHVHTGEIVHSHAILYFCAISKWWVTNKICEETGRPHNRCRIDDSTSEKILIGDEALEWMGAGPDADDEDFTDETIEEYLKRRLKEELDKKFEAQPWWCLLCGEGGNYEGNRPDFYWFPPKDHVCKKGETLKDAFPDLFKGITDG